MLDNKLAKGYNPVEFEANCLQYIVPLRSLAGYLTFDASEADDLLQDTLLRGYRFFHKFEIKTNCKAWLFKIMKNLFINQYKQSKKRSVVLSLDNPYNKDITQCTIANKDKYSNPEITILSKMFHVEVDTALESIPKKYRDIVVLADIHCYSYEEISRVAKCPIGTVRSRLHRGRNLLRKHLEPNSS